ncbi:hypothetical protein [Bdellovibrio bacteriovorus]|uniref:hypothetical protein n=1 Tax=Bdellovibrio bacteriovorus TaxID=959 RepID=UPI0035A746E0
MATTTTNKKLLIGAAILVVGAAAGYGLYTRKGGVAGSALSSGRSNQSNLQELKRAQSLAVNTHLSSKTGQAWKSHNFADLMAAFGVEKTAKENRDFFQASIFVLDVAPPQFKAEEKKDIESLQHQIVTFLTQDAKVIGDLAQVHSYAAKTLVKLGTPTAEDLKHLEGFYKKSKDARKEIIADILIQTEPLSAEGKTILNKQLLSKNDVTQGMQLLARVRDGEARKELFNKVYKNYSAYPAAVKPFVYKQLALNHNLIQGDLKKHLVEAAKSTDEKWEDSFLVAVQELDCVNEFVADIQRIQSQSQHPHLKMLAGAILAKDKGIK